MLQNWTENVYLWELPLLLDGHFDLLPLTWNTLIIQISELQVQVLIIVPLHQWNAEPYFNLAETFSECNKFSEMKNELTDTDMLFRTGDSGAAGTAPRRDVLHGGSAETVRDIRSLTDWAPAESGHRGCGSKWYSTRDAIRLITTAPEKV